MADIVIDKEDPAKEVEEGLDQVVIDVIEDKMNVAVVNKVTRVYSWVYTFLCVGQPQTFRRLDFLFFCVLFLLLIGRPCLLYVRALSEGT